MSKHDYEEIPVLEPVTVRCVEPTKRVAIEGTETHNNVPINAEELLDLVYEIYLQDASCYTIPTTRGQAIKNFESCIRAKVAEYWAKVNEQSRDEAALHGEE